MLAGSSGSWRFSILLVLLVFDADFEAVNTLAQIGHKGVTFTAQPDSRARCSGAHIFRRVYGELTFD